MMNKNKQSKRSITYSKDIVLTFRILFSALIMKLSLSCRTKMVQRSIHASSDTMTEIYKIKLLRQLMNIKYLFQLVEHFWKT
jgi:hypothetical protein